MITGMGKKYLGRAALLVALAGNVGLLVGIDMFWDAFCLLPCREDQQQSTDPGLAVMGVSLLVEAVALTAAIVAARRGLDRGWAQAGIVLASLPLAAALFLFIAAILMFGFR